MRTYNALPEKHPEPTEAPLHPHHLNDPSRPDSPDPVYWVTPRHLAGDDGVLAERIGDSLADLGWRMWPTARHTLLYVSPDGLCGAEWILAAYPFELGGLPVAWQLSARPYAASAMAEWNAYFTSGVPYEALVDLLVALDAREAPDVGCAGPVRRRTSVVRGPRRSSTHSVRGAGFATWTGPAPPPSTPGSPPASPWRCCRR